MVKQETLIIETAGRGSHDISQQINRIVDKSRIKLGLCNIFILHTSASLILCENADVSVRKDLETFMQNLVVDGDAMFSHAAEGPDDMPAHVRSILTGSSITVPVDAGQCLLGTWQGIYLWEHRYQAHSRKLVVTVYGD
jgi:secondary thiamine-phosphate synthase enzyme